MNTLNVSKINKDNLADIRDIVINPKLPKEERIKSFVEQIKNPLCYKCGDYIVNIKFSDDSDRTIDDCFRDYLCNL